MRRTIKLHLTKNLFVATSIIISIAITTMHAAHGYFGIPVKGFFIACITLLICTAFFYNNIKILPKYFYMSLLLILCGVVGSAVSQSSFQLIQCVTLAAVFISVAINKRIICTNLCAKIIINLALVCLLCALVGYVYAFSGGEPLFSVLNEETALELPFYLTTFTNSVYGNTIRPAAFFDEPGALAMFSIMAAGVNEIYGGKKWMTILLIFLSSITFSLMAPIALLVFIIINHKFILKIENIKYIFITIIISIITYLINKDAIDFLLVDRLKIVDGAISGDNRMTQVYTFFSNINSQIFVNGSHALGLENGGGGVANPFTILYDSGFFVWIPYALLIFWLIYLSTKKGSNHQFPSLILALLLLQRPYIYSLYWSLFIAYYIIFLIERNSLCCPGVNSRK